jgi:hypothetical protein
MSGIPQGQVAFLLLCIKNSTGKIDWNAVAREYEMLHGEPLSASAASQRLGRLKAKMELLEKPTNARKPPVKKESPKKRGSSPRKEMSPNKGKKVKVEIKEEDDWIFQK